MRVVCISLNPSPPKQKTIHNDPFLRKCVVHTNLLGSEGGWGPKLPVWATKCLVYVLFLSLERPLIFWDGD